MDIRKIVSEIISKRCDISSISEDDKLLDLGLDSLDLVETMLEIEEALGIEFDSEEIADADSLKDILKIIEKKIQ